MAGSYPNFFFSFIWFVDCILLSYLLFVSVNSYTLSVSACYDDHHLHRFSLIVLFVSLPLHGLKTEEKPTENIDEMGERNYKIKTRSLVKRLTRYIVSRPNFFSVHDLKKRMMLSVAGLHRSILPPLSASFFLLLLPILSDG